MKIKLFFVSFCLFYAASAQDTEKIRLLVRVINGIDGTEIKNVSVKVAYALTENTIPLKTEKRSSFYEVVKGADLKVSAEASQYYTEEKRFETESLYDQDILEVTLTPKPTETVAEVSPPPVAEPPPPLVENFTEHEYALIDSHTGQPVMKSQLFILDADNRPVETLFNSSRGTYLTYRINPQKTFRAEVKAEGYEPLSTPLNSTSRNITLVLTPADLEKVTLAVQDAYTREMLSLRQLKIYSSAQKEILTQEEKGEHSALLNLRNTYRVQFETEGYTAFDQQVGPQAFQGEKLEIMIRKPVYPLALQIQNELTEDQKKGASASVNPAEGIALPVSFDPEKNSFLLESDPDETLQISITVPGFRPYIASNNRKQLAQFQLKVQLEPEIITPPVVADTMAEITPPVEEVAPPVVTPPVVETSTPVVAEEEKPVPQQDVPMEAKKGRRYALNGVNFEQSQTTMLQGSETKLREVLQFLTDNPRVSIEVIGHTDRTGDERQNQRLSEFRARAVANWLFNHGIDPQRIQTSGKGSSEPVADNRTEEGKAQNRRIEVMVTED